MLRGLTTKYLANKEPKFQTVIFASLIMFASRTKVDHLLSDIASPQFLSGVNY